MKINLTSLLYSLMLSALLALSACSFKKDLGNPQSQEKLSPFAKIPERQFCEDFHPNQKIGLTELIPLSASDQVADLCYAWRHLENVEASSLTPVELDIFDNFTSSLLKLLKLKQISDLKVDAVVKKLTLLSKEKTSLERIIALNNISLNQHNNTSFALDLAKMDKIEVLFLETDILSLDQFSEYSSKISTLVTRSSFCTERNLLKIQSVKVISPHIYYLLNACNVDTSASKLVIARIKYQKKISDPEYQFFTNGVRAKYFKNSNEDVNEAGFTQINAITRSDKNLFRIGSMLKPNSHLFLECFNLALKADIAIEPLLMQLQQNDVEPFLTWDAFEKVLNSTHFPRIIYSLKKYSLVPTQKQTQNILRNLIAHRPIVGDIRLKDQTAILLIDYLRSTTNSGLSSKELQTLITHELNLLLLGQVRDPEVYNHITFDDLKRTDIPFYLSPDGVVFSSQNSTFPAFRIDGEIFDNLFLNKSKTDAKLKRMIYIQDEETHEILFISKKDFYESLTSQDSYINYKELCDSSNALNGCELTKKKYGAALVRAANYFRKRFLKENPTPPQNSSASPEHLDKS